MLRHDAGSGAAFDPIDLTPGAPMGAGTIAVAPDLQVASVGTALVPVRVWADTAYGQLSVVANSLKIDGQPAKGG